MFEITVQKDYYDIFVFVQCSVENYIILLNNIRLFSSVSFKLYINVEILGTSKCMTVIQNNDYCQCFLKRFMSLCHDEGNLLFVYWLCPCPDDKLFEKSVQKDQLRDHGLMLPGHAPAIHLTKREHQVNVHDFPCTYLCLYCFAFTPILVDRRRESVSPNLCCYRLGVQDQFGFNNCLKNYQIFLKHLYRVADGTFLRMVVSRVQQQSKERDLKPILEVIK